MAEYTPNSKLYKPSRLDDIDVDTSLAENFTIIDAQLVQTENKTSNVYHVRQWGADCGGEIDDTLAIQQALDELPNNSILQLGEKHKVSTNPQIRSGFETRSTFYIKDKKNIKICGSNTEIIERGVTQSIQGLFTTRDCENVKFADFSFDGETDFPNETYYSGFAVACENNSKKITLDNIHVKNCHGIFLSHNEHLVEDITVNPNCTSYRTNYGVTLRRNTKRATLGFTSQVVRRALFMYGTEDVTAEYFYSDACVTGLRLGTGTGNTYAKNMKIKAHVLQSTGFVFPNGFSELNGLQMGVDENVELEGIDLEIIGNGYIRDIRICDKLGVKGKNIKVHGFCKNFGVSGVTYGVQIGSFATLKEDIKNIVYELRTNHIQAPTTADVAIRNCSNVAINNALIRGLSGTGLELRDIDNVIANNTMINAVTRSVWLNNANFVTGRIIADKGKVAQGTTSNDTLEVIVNSSLNVAV